MALILFFSQSFGWVFSQQKASFKWSAYEKVGKYSQAIFQFEVNKNFGVLIKSEARFHNNFTRYHLLIYDVSLKLDTQLHFSIHKFNESILDIWTHEHYLYLITQAKLPNQRLAARLRVFNLDTLSKSSKTIDLLIINKNHFSRDLNFKYSRQANSFSLWHTNTILKEDENQSLTYQEFNYQLKMQDQAKIELLKKAELCKIYRVDKLENHAFLIYSKEYDIRPLERRGFSSNYTLGFYLVNPGIDTLKSFYTKNENIYAERGRMKWDRGILDAAGLFSTKLDGPKLGIWFIKYDFNNNLMLADTALFFDKKIKELPTNGFQSTLMKNSKLEAFFLDYYIKINKEERLIIAEQFFLLPASIGSSYTYNRFYGDVLLLYLDSVGNIFKANRLVKAQQTFNNFGEYSSYYLERNGSSFMFFFNEHYKNEKKYLNKHLVWHRHSILAVNDVRPEKIIRYSLGNYKNLGGIIQVRDMVQLKNNEYLIYANKRKKGKLGIMTLSNITD